MHHLTTDNSYPASAASSSSNSASQTDSQNNNSPTPTATATDALATDTSSITGSSQPTDSSSATTGDSQNTASKTASATGKQSGSTHTTGKPTVTAVDPRLPAGGIQMMSPAATDPATYYKVGDQVTFGWNYTSLVVSPTAVDILVKCSANSATYTLSSNSSVKETGSVVWDTALDRNGQDPLLTAKYTLVIHDSDQDVTAVPSAGHLGAYSQFTFGMYLKQEYTPLGGGFMIPVCWILCNSTDGVFQISCVRRAAVRYRIWSAKHSSSSLLWA